jgi:hypothetical protein
MGVAVKMKAKKGTELIIVNGDQKQCHFRHPFLLTQYSSERYTWVPPKSNG